MVSSISDLNSNESNVCTICTDPVESQVFKTFCEHIFHESCILTWLDVNNTCPNCRKRIITDETNNIADSSRSADETNRVADSMRDIVIDKCLMILSLVVGLSLLFILCFLVSLIVLIPAFFLL